MRASRIITVTMLLIIGSFQGTLAMELAQDKGRPLLELLPKDIWDVIADKLPGDNAFLIELARRLVLSDAIYRKIVDAFSKKAHMFPLPDEVEAVLWSHFCWTRTPESSAKFKKAFLASMKECDLSRYTKKQDIPSLLDTQRPIFPDAVVAPNGDEMETALDLISQCISPYVLKQDIERFRILKICAGYTLRLLRKYSYEHTMTGMIMPHMRKLISLRDSRFGFWGECGVVAAMATYFFPNYLLSAGGLTAIAVSVAGTKVFLNFAEKDRDYLKENEEKYLRYFINIETLMHHCNERLDALAKMKADERAAMRAARLAALRNAQ